MDIKKLIKLQNAIIKAHQKIKDVQSDNALQTKEIKDEFKKEFNGLNKALELLNKELSSFTKKEDLSKHNEELGHLKDTLNEINKSVDDKISKIQLKHGKDGVNGIDGKDGRDGKDGKNGIDGRDGKDGKDGANGLSAYEIAVNLGYEGTEEEWIDHITNNGGRSYEGQIVSMNQRLNKVTKTIEELSNGSGIQELSGDINIYDLEQGIYMLSGENTKLKRNAYTFMSKPVTNAYSKSILVFLREADYGEQGFLFKTSTANPYVQLYMFDRTTVKEVNMMNILTTTNTSSYAVTSSYQPAHKQYVDNAINQVKGEVGGIVDLGLIEMQDYDDDIDVFMQTLTTTGRYRFVDSFDNFNWYVEVQELGNRVGQFYWYTEEGYTCQYFRDGWYNEDEDTYEWNPWTTYMTYDWASTAFASAYHEHYRTQSVDDLRTWLDTMRDFTTKAWEVTQTSDKHKFIANVYYYNYYVTAERKYKYVIYQDYFDLEEPSKIYKRTGYAPAYPGSSNVTWGEWQVFEPIDYSNYYTKEEIDNKFAEIIDGDEVSF